MGDIHRPKIFDETTLVDGGPDFPCRPADPEVTAERRAPSMRPLYLHGTYEPFAAMFHPATGAGSHVGVVMCPPFGWEEISSYSPRREWAKALAQRGIPTLRIDLPGTGDSGGYPTGESRVDAWIEAIGLAADWLVGECDCERVAAIGIGVGGLLAYCAAASGAPIEDLVLWGAPSQGRRFIRETRAFGQLEDDQDHSAETDRKTLPDGWLSAGGYVITAETRAALETLDVSRLELPHGDQRHALLLTREGITVDQLLEKTLERQGVSVTTIPGEGYGEMIVEPQFARLPQVALEACEWIGKLPPKSPLSATPHRPPQVSEDMRVLAPDGTLVRESFFTVPHPLGSMFGVLSEPLGERSQMTALLLGGTGHRIGPNRMWVEAARRWAAMGIPSVRLDMGGAGDAEGASPPDIPTLYRDEMVEQVGCALDALSEMGLPSLTAVLGLCAAAYWATHAALRGKRQVIPVLINPRALMWDSDRYSALLADRYLSRLRHVSAWRELARRERSQAQVRTALRRGITAVHGTYLRTVRGRGLRPSAARDLEQVFDQLRDQGTSVAMLFTGNEPLYQQLQSQGQGEMERWPNVYLQVVPGHSDWHTLRPLWLQRRTHELLDQALQHELAGTDKDSSAH